MHFIVESESAPCDTDLDGLSGAWRWLLGLGAVMVLLGAAAITAAILVTMMTVIFVGALMTIGGALQTIHAITLRRLRGYRLEISTGLLYLIAGLAILLNPESTALALALILSLILVCAGIFRIVTGIVGNDALRPWRMLYGVLNLMLAYLIWHDWPAAGLSIIGLLIGLELLGNGFAVAMLGLTVRRAFPRR